MEYIGSTPYWGRSRGRALLVQYHHFHPRHPQHQYLPSRPLCLVRGAMSRPPRAKVGNRWRRADQKSGVWLREQVTFPRMARTDQQDRFSTSGYHKQAGRPWLVGEGEHPPTLDEASASRCLFILFASSGHRLAPPAPQLPMPYEMARLVGRGESESDWRGAGRGH